MSETLLKVLFLLKLFVYKVIENTKAGIMKVIQFIKKYYWIVPVVFLSYVAVSFIITNAFPADSPIQKINMFWYIAESARK